MNSFKRLVATAALPLSLLLSGCGEQAPQNKAVYLLIDTSGTYTQELNKAQAILNYLLANLDSGDSIAVAVAVSARKTSSPKPPSICVPAPPTIRSVSSSWPWMSSPPT